MVKAEQLPRHLLTRGLRGALVPDDLSEGSGADLISKAIRFQPRASDRIWTTPNHWVWARLGDVFQVNVGSTPSRANPGFWKGDLPWVSSGEVAFNRITRTRENIAFEAAGNPAARIHPPGTVLLAMIGEGKTRGQCAILDITAAHNQNCASIRVPETRILSEYVYGYLEERYLETRRSGSGGQQPALNKRTIQNFPVPVAPLGTQRRLVAAWSAARETTGRLREELGKATTRAQVLRRALLNAAFSGRLTGRSSDLDRVRELAGV
jgi:type I restriction enzyme S subunit